MAQNLVRSIANQKGAQWTTSFADSIAALASLNSGTTAPGTTNAGLPWLDTTTNQLKLRDVGDAEWVPVMRQSVKIDERSWSGVSFTAWAMCPVRGATVERVRVVSTTATTSDGSNNYNLDLYNVTDSHSLFGTTQTTNGSEMVANTPYDLTPNQNATITGDDAVEFRVVANGLPTSLTRVAVFVDWVWLVD